MLPTSPYAWSTSGGKDSLLALWYAKQQGYRITTMITMFDETGSRSRSHGIGKSLMQDQALALGMELVTPHASWQTYETEFVTTLKALAASGHQGVLFGDIDLLPHREWEEKVCAQANLVAYLPLWQRDRKQLALEALRLGFKAIVVCVDHKHLSSEYCGRQFDREFVDSLPASVDACGENGEFHTFVYDGPLFSTALDVCVVNIEDYQAPTEFGGGRFSFARLA